ncbi:MAG: hypothetical protein DMF55_01670 [Acidobacteria bacterium]|nr:MAG: hypothetical protein DMF55_01670 [Acidobacteriota bacterium]
MAGVRAAQHAANRGHRDRDGNPCAAVDAVEPSDRGPQQECRGRARKQQQEEEGRHRRRRQDLEQDPARVRIPQDLFR